MSKKIISIIVVALILAVSGYAFAQYRNTSEPDSKTTQNSSSMMGSMTGDSMMGMMNMSDSVEDDESFIENMIPHHQEAVDSSNQILNSTGDPELKMFVQNVIADQTKEISEMKLWYKNWFNKDYTSNSNYQAMMGGMKDKTGIDLDKEYVKGMIMHHQGAIQMATKIQTITKRPELIKLANDIITSQTAEKNTLMDWMMSKYNDHGMMGM